MERICAWCGESLGRPSRGADAAQGHSHGMCRSCLDVQLRSLSRPREALSARLRRLLVPPAPASPTPA